MLKEAMEAYHRGDDSIARFRCMACLVADPRLPDAWNLLGALARRASEKEQALQYCQRVLDILPDNIQALASQSNLLLDQQKMVESIEILKRIVAIDPHWGNAYATLEQLLWKTGDLAGASHYLCQRAVRGHKKKPPLADQCFQGALVDFQASEIDKALLRCQCTLVLEPARADGWNLRAILLRSRRNFAGVLISYQRAAWLLPQYTPVIFNFGNQE